MPIHLLAPSLLDSWPDSDLQQPLPEFPFLERLLARADQQSAPSDYPRTLFDLLDMPFPSQGSLPTAHLCWLADTHQQPPANLLHADPVYLKPDMDNVQLFRPENLNMEQAQTYARAFNDFYENHGFRMQSPTPDRWYVSAHQSFETPEANLDQVTGRNLRSFLTAGEQSKEWNGLFTEVQMLFHDLGVNQDRQAGGKLPVSGVWLSGGGEPPVVGRHAIETVRGDDPLLHGLAIHAGLSQADEDGLAGSNYLVVMQDCHEAGMAMDYSAWLDAVQQVEESLGKWINNENQVILYPCNGRSWHWRPKNKNRLWRRKQSLPHYLVTGDR